jgi:hypothetical protein
VLEKRIGSLVITAALRGMGHATSAGGSLRRAGLT